MTIPDNSHFCLNVPQIYHPRRSTSVIQVIIIQHRHRGMSTNSYTLKDDYFDITFININLGLCALDKVRYVLSSSRFVYWLLYFDGWLLQYHFHQYLSLSLCVGQSRVYIIVIAVCILTVILWWMTTSISISVFVRWTKWDMYYRHRGLHTDCYTLIDYYFNITSTNIYLCLCVLDKVGYISSSSRFVGELLYFDWLLL